MKRHAPATMRNRDPILGVLREVFDEAGTVLEIASGTGEHAVWFARDLPHLEWRPTDVDDTALESIEAHRADARLPNLRSPVRLDVRDEDWGPAAEGVSAILCVNMIHIAPWSCCEGLMRGAGRILASGAPLVTYGPYRFDGAFTAPSNERFDASLRGQDPSWGVRDAGDVTHEAEAQGLVRERIVEMPANNHVLAFRRR